MQPNRAAHGGPTPDDVLRTRVALFVIYVVWGANFLAIGVAVRDLAPAAMMGARFLVAGSLLFALSTRFSSRGIPQRTAWAQAVRPGILLIVGGSGLLAWGQVYVDSSIAAVVIATIPLWILVLQPTKRSPRLSVRSVIAVGVGICGVAILVYPRAVAPVSPLGALLLLAAAICWALGSRFSQKRDGDDALASTAMQMTVGGAILSLIAIILMATGKPLGQLTREGLIAVIWLIVVSSMLGLTSYTYALSHAPISAVAGYPYANTVVAFALGVLILQEPLTGHRLLGSATVLFALLLLATQRVQIGARVHRRSAHWNDER